MLEEDQGLNVLRRQVPVRPALNELMKMMIILGIYRALSVCLFMYVLCLWSDWFCRLTWQRVNIDVRRVEKCIFAYDPSLTVLRWPCVVDRTLKSSYCYSVPQSALQLITNIGKGANLDQQYFKRQVIFIFIFYKASFTGREGGWGTLRASLSGTLLQTLPDLVTPLKGYSLCPHSCPEMRLALSERFRY